MWKIWIILAGLFLILESITTGFLVFWFSIGSLIAMLVSFFIDNIIIQTAVFIVSSSLLLILTKPLVKKFIKNVDTHPTNYQSLVGKEGIVLEDIDSINGTGQVKVKGELWSATSDTKIEKDAKVKVLSVNGVKLNVEKQTD